jgi:hypothetical protein
MRAAGHGAREAVGRRGPCPLVARPRGLVEAWAPNRFCVCSWSCLCVSPCSGGIVKSGGAATSEDGLKEPLTLIELVKS